MKKAYMSTRRNPRGLWKATWIHRVKVFMTNLSIKMTMCFRQWTQAELKRTMPLVIFFIGALSALPKTHITTVNTTRGPCWILRVTTRTAGSHTLSLTGTTESIIPAAQAAWIFTCHMNIPTNTAQLFTRLEAQAGRMLKPWISFLVLTAERMSAWRLMMMLTSAHPTFMCMRWLCRICFQKLAIQMFQLKIL